MLDALPGEVRTGGRETQDHPAALIAHLQHIALPLPNRTALQNNLLDSGFSLTVARWASTNLRPLNGDHRCCSLSLLCIVCRPRCQDHSPDISLFFTVHMSFPCTSSGLALPFPCTSSGGHRYGWTSLSFVVHGLRQLHGNNKRWVC